MVQKVYSAADQHEAYTTARSKRRTSVLQNVTHDPLRRLDRQLPHEHLRVLLRVLFPMSVGTRARRVVMVVVGVVVVLSMRRRVRRCRGRRRAHHAGQVAQRRRHALALPRVHRRHRGHRASQPEAAHRRRVRLAPVPMHAPGLSRSNRGNVGLEGRCRRYGESERETSAQRSGKHPAARVADA